MLPMSRVTLRGTPIIPFLLHILPTGSSEMRLTDSAGVLCRYYAGTAEA